MQHQNRKKPIYDQHFLASTITLKYINQHIKEYFYKSNVYEIGPGKGAVTEILLKNCKKVLSVEIDSSMNLYLQKLKAIYGDQFHIIYSDAHSINLEKFNYLEDCDLIFSSLPYSIASQLLFKYLQETSVKNMLFIMQKELASKLIFKKARQIDVFSAKMQCLIENSKIIFNIPRHAFQPNPKVESVLIQIESKAHNKRHKRLDEVFRFLEICFKSKRQLLKNNLIRAFEKNSSMEDIKLFVEAMYKEFPLKKTIRAEELKLEELLELENHLYLYKKSQ